MKRNIYEIRVIFGDNEHHQYVEVKAFSIEGALKKAKRQYLNKYTGGWVEPWDWRGD